MRVSQDIYMEAGVCLVGGPCKKLEWVCVGGGMMLGTGRSRLVAAGLWPGIPSPWSWSGPRFGWFHVYISETESWDLISQGVKVAWLDAESW